MNIKPVSDKLRQFLLMKQPIAEADQRASATGSIAVGNTRAARLLLAAAESFDHETERQLGAIVILREAAVVAAQGMALREQVASADSDLATLWKAVLELPGAQPAIQVLSAEARERLDLIVNQGFTAKYGEWSPSELSALSQSLLTVVRQLVVQLESDVLAPKRLRFQRVLRWAAVVVGLVLIVGYGVSKIRHMMRPAPTNTGSTNVALNKSVTMSSNWRADIYPPARLVDGDVSQLGCHSELQQNPWALIDLDAEYNIHQIVVTNRLDGLTASAVPLLIETSLDGHDFRTYAQKDQDFKTWTAKSKPTVARYVRLTVLNAIIMHLNEVEVY